MSIVSIIQNKTANYVVGEEMFYPDKPYPELEGLFDRHTESNSVFSIVRQTLLNLQLDYARRESPSWNPLGDIVSPGQTVLIKPNLVTHDNSPCSNRQCLYTQANVVSSILPYVVLALEGEGRIIIGDAPVQECDFEQLIVDAGYKQLVQFYERKGIFIDLLDFRCVKTTFKHGARRQEYCNQDTVEIDLKENSEHASLTPDQISSERITNFDPSVLSSLHSKHHHRYILSKHALDADLIISVPKPKTHRLAGCTLSLKNLVGLVAKKESLPHHRRGSQKSGGDEFQKSSPLLTAHTFFVDRRNVYLKSRSVIPGKIIEFFDRALLKIDKEFVSHETIRAGGWFGNDTIWRTVLDLCKIALYSDNTGRLHSGRQRVILSIADMIVCGEGNGPLHPTPFHSGIIAASFDMVALDEVLATIMGFDISKMPLYRNARFTAGYELYNSSNPRIVSNNLNWNSRSYTDIPRDSMLKLKPGDNWRGHIER